MEDMIDVKGEFTYHAANFALVIVLAFVIAVSVVTMAVWGLYTLLPGT